jgi:uncharacterized membrane protein YsdA (DUF1294 family)
MIFDLFYLFCINVITFLVYAHDKFQAIYDRRRVPEATLLTLAAIGGAFGELCAMWLFRHKTKKQKFALWVPIFLLCHVAIEAILRIALT